MFVFAKKHLSSWSVVTAAAIALAGSATAQENNLTVELTGLQASEGNLYLSVQSKEDYQQRRGAAGGVYKVESAGTQTYSLAVPAGVYAVSIWHDTDNDGKFSMDENQIPTDGWGMSGTPSTDKEPTFEEVKVDIPAGKSTVSISMIYRN